ncbi:MAG: ABC transporter permease [Deltaproteobacteria bacterium]|nr:ABC transporter permease [Deltaproteobacteria bacterium]
MRIWDTLALAQREIRRNTMRSILTALGIVIGVAAVIALVTIGTMASARITAEVAGLGNNLLMVYPGAERKGTTSVSAALLTPDDARAIAREVPAARTVAPVLSRAALVVTGDRNWNTTVTGTTNDYLVVRSYTLATGRAFSDAELVAGTPVCLLGASVRRELFRTQDPVGASVRVGHVACTVIGAIASKGAASFGPDQDDFVLMPLAAVQRRIAGTTDLDAIYISAASAHATQRAKAQITELMRERRRIEPDQASDFTVQDMAEITRALGQITGILTALLGAIAAVSLLVGGIGIMNILLVSVTERTREIGIRLAIGALAREVLMQFLIEAAVLSTVGGAMGLGLGVGVSYLVARAFALPFVILPTTIALALGFSTAIGLVFGYVPARKASRKNPIEALRHE